MGGQQKGVAGQQEGVGGGAGTVWAGSVRVWAGATSRGRNTLVSPGNRSCPGPWWEPPGPCVRAGAGPGGLGRGGTGAVAPRGGGSSERQSPGWGRTGRMNDHHQYYSPGSREAPPAGTSQAPATDLPPEQEQEQEVEEKELRKQQILRRNLYRMNRRLRSVFKFSRSYYAQYMRYRFLKLRWINNCVVNFV